MQELIWKSGRASDALIRDMGVRLPSDGVCGCVRVLMCWGVLVTQSCPNIQAVDVDDRHLGGQRAVLLNHPNQRKQAYQAWTKVIMIV